MFLYMTSFCMALGLGSVLLNSARQFFCGADCGG